MILKLIIIVVLIGTSILVIYSLFRNSDYIYDKISFKEALDLTDLPIITFLIAGKKYNFMLDTGANLSIINEEVLKEIPYEKENTVGKIYGLEGNEQIVNYVQVDLSYKNNNYKERMQVVDMRAAFNSVKQESGVTLHGILGNQFFQKYKYVLDFNELVAYSK